MDVLLWQYILWKHYCHALIVLMYYMYILFNSIAVNFISPVTCVAISHWCSSVFQCYKCFEVVGKIALLLLCCAFHSLFFLWNLFWTLGQWSSLEWRLEPVMGGACWTNTDCMYLHCVRVFFHVYNLSISEDLRFSYCLDHPY